MAKDRQSLIVVLLVINTLLLGGIALKIFGCYSKSGFCPLKKKVSSKMCPLSKKGSSTDSSVDTLMNQKGSDIIPSDLVN